MIERPRPHRTRNRTASKSDTRNKLPRPHLLDDAFNYLVAMLLAEGTRDNVVHYEVVGCLSIAPTPATPKIDRAE